MLKSLQRVSFLSLVFFLTLSLTAFANSDDERFIIEADRVLDTETDKEYGSAFKYNNKGEVEEVSIEELKKLLENEGKANIPNKLQEENTSLDKEINPIQPSYLHYIYTQSGATTSVGNRIAVSAWVSCPDGNQSCSITSTTGWSVGESFSVGIDTSGAESAVRGSASFTWNKSVTRSNSYSLPIDPEERGRMMFYPENNYTYGTLNTFSGSTLLSSKFVNAHSPKKVAGTGEPDGTFFIEFSS